MPRDDFASSKSSATFAALRALISL